MRILLITTLLCGLSGHPVLSGRSLLKHKAKAAQGNVATSFAHFWQNTNYDSSQYRPQRKHYGPVGDGGYVYERHHGKPKYHPHFDESEDFPDLFDFDGDEFGEPSFYGPHHGERHHPGGPHHGERHHPGRNPGRPHHPDNGYHYNKPEPPRSDNGYHYNKPEPARPDTGYHYNRPEPPRRFPPPPVYDSDFINPWGGVTSPKPPVLPNTQPTRPTEPSANITPTMVAPTTPTNPGTATISSTPDPLLTTTNEDGLIYDIDLRFGQ